jgi:hypothetical protein
MGAPEMPYTTPHGGFERASRLGHSASVIAHQIDAARNYYIPPAAKEPFDWLGPLLVPAGQVPGDPAPVDLVIAVDGSRLEVKARRDFPSALYAWYQVAGVLVDLAALDQQAAERFVDPVAMREAMRSSVVTGDLPSSGAYMLPGRDSRESWRLAVFENFRTKRLVAGPNRHLSLLDMLFWVYGTPDKPAATLTVNRCPTRDPYEDDDTTGRCNAAGITVGREPSTCPGKRCGVLVYPTDALRIWEEVNESGSNQVPLGRLSQTAELLVALGLLSLVYWYRKPDVQRLVLMVDGPLAMFGPVGKLKTQALHYVQAMAAALRAKQMRGPHVVGIEKDGTFADYAHALAHAADGKLVPPQTLIRVDDPLIRRVLNRSTSIGHARDDYWGRRFMYRTNDGRIHVLTVPPAAGLPYDAGLGQPDPASYPTLPTLLRVLDRTGTRLYRDAVIPIAFAHDSAAIPLGVGSDVLTLIAQEKLGMRTANPA